MPSSLFATDLMYVEDSKPYVGRCVYEKQNRHKWGYTSSALLVTGLQHRYDKGCGVYYIYIVVFPKVLYLIASFLSFNLRPNPSPLELSLIAEANRSRAYDKNTS